MRHTLRIQLSALVIALTATLLAGNWLLAADPTSRDAAKPAAVRAAGPVVRPNVTRALAGGLLPVTPPAVAVPTPQKVVATAAKLKELGAQLRRALDIAVDLFSGNEAELLSKNKTKLFSGNEAELLSGNKTKLLSDNKPKILSDNKPKILSDNSTPIFSENRFSLFSNLKIEIHINNSGNRPMPGPAAQPVRGRASMTPSAMQPVPTFVPSATPQPIPQSR
jgi:hypothetical protein